MKKLNEVVQDFNIQEHITKLQHSSMFKGYNIDTNNFLDFYEVMSDAKNCKNCNGLSECQNKMEGFCHVVSKDGEKQYFSVKPCRYKAIDQSHTTIKTKYISEELLKANLEDFTLNTKERAKAFEYAGKFVKKMVAKEFIEGPYVSGTYGAGKTYYLSALANELSKNGIEVFMMYFPDLSREMKAMMFKPELEDLINQLKTVDVLMIDDLGGEVSTSWLRDEVLGTILNYRAQSKKPVCISSNLTLDDLHEHFAVAKDEQGITKDEFKASRLIERIKRITADLEL